MPVLADTNILVRAVERRHPLLRNARLAVLALVRNGEELRVTPQNIAEFWNDCTRPVNLNGLGNSITGTDRSPRVWRRFLPCCRIRWRRFGYGVVSS
jgi:predicted nucleic acid-binding protein